MAAIGDNTLSPATSGPLNTQESITSRSSAANGDSKWNTLRRAVKKQALQLVGLEHPGLLQEHQDAVQRSIVVGKISRDLVRDPSSHRSVEPSLVQAIAPHKTVSPLVTDSLLRHLASVGGDSTKATPTPLSTSSKEPHPLHMEEYELQKMSHDMRQAQLETSSSEPSFQRFGSLPRPHPPNIEKSLSLPGHITGNTKPHPLSHTYLSKPTGRLHSLDIAEQDTKPDLWKIAYYGVKFLTRAKAAAMSEEREDQLEQDGRSFNDSTHKEGVAEEEDFPSIQPSLGRQTSLHRTTSTKSQQQPEMEEDHSFFGHEYELPSYEDTLTRNRYVPLTVDGKVMGSIAEEEGAGPDGDRPDLPTYYPSDYYTGQYEHTPTSVKGTLQRHKSRIRSNDKQPVPSYDETQYRPPFKVLGGRTLRLLNFRYKHVPPSTLHKLNELQQKGFHRPFFTYWLMTVQVIVLVFTLAVYGFAPYGFDQFTERALVQQSNLAVEVVERIVVPNVWGGPPQSALVLLGATYGPCMRRDRQLYEGVESDRVIEGNSSGCCVRRDQSGCVQVPSADDCPSTFADFIFTDPSINTSVSLYTDRTVCGTSPRTCINPDPARDSRWHSSTISGWPICTEVQTIENSSSHLTCNVTGRPCCVGVQAQCIVTTQEHCRYLEGRFHSDAFLCSQVDCLGDVCGLLPFVSMNQPDQIYRLLTALFLHAGIIHLVFTLVFHFLILRHVEKYLGWLPTGIIYLFSGMGGNLISILFIPYNPEVGPAGGIFGIIAFFLIYIMYQAHRLIRPWLEALKLLIVILILLGCGLFPFIDNYAHIGGFVFGILLSGIFVPYYRPNEAELEYYKRKYGKVFNQRRDWIQISKYLFLTLGTAVLVCLYGLFLVLFYVVQNPSWSGFAYLNCIPFTATFCLDFQQNIRSRDIIY